MNVEFFGEIRQVNTRKLTSNDVGTRIVIEKDALDPGTLAMVNAMFSVGKNKQQLLRITISEE